MTEIIKLRDFLRIPSLPFMFYKSRVIHTNYARRNIIHVKHRARHAGPRAPTKPSKQKIWRLAQRQTPDNLKSHVSWYLPVSPSLALMTVMGNTCARTFRRSPAAFFLRLRWSFLSLCCSRSGSDVLPTAFLPLHTETIFL